MEDGEVKTKKDKNARKQKKQRKFTKKSFLCPVCGRDFKDKPGKYEHMRNRRNKTCEAEFFSCECPGFQKVNSNGKSYGHNFFWRKYIHIKVIHLGFLGCVSPNCLQVFEKEEDLENHTKKVHHEEEEFQSKYVCGKCGKDFNKFLETGTRQKLQNHMKRHKENEEFVDKYACVECGKEFNKFTETGVRKKFDKHMRIHQVLGFKCNCPNIPTVTVTERGLKGSRMGGYFLIKERHIRVKHENYHGCEDCIKFFQTTEELTSHRFSHRMDICQLCNKKVNVQRMADHRKQHEEDPCQCSTCGKSFKNNRFLSNHKKVHIHEVCPDCGGTFSKLKEHIESKHQQDEEKRFHCNECGKGLANKFTLKSHIMSVHLNVQPHQWL